MKRLFIAIPISDESRTEIFRNIIDLEICRKLPVRWTSEKNLHLTLQFLGDVEEKRIPELKRLLDQYPVSANRQILSFSRIGAFPNMCAPNIIWLGFNKNDVLMDIQRKLTQDLIDSGFQADRKRYKPHLTLGRVRNNAAISPKIFGEFVNQTSSIKISDSPLYRITLFESQLRPGGPIYTALSEKRLY